MGNLDKLSSFVSLRGAQRTFSLLLASSELPRAVGAAAPAPTAKVPSTKVALRKILIRSPAFFSSIAAAAGWSG